MYENFINDNIFTTLPFFKIPETENDSYVEWTTASRLDKIAYSYYDNAALWKFLLLANPKYLSEADIEIGDVIRVPMTKEDMFNFIRQRVEQSRLF